MTNTTELWKAKSVSPGEAQGFAAVVERSSSGIVIVDEAGEVQYANPAAGRMFGNRRNGLVGARFGLPSVVGSREIRMLGWEGKPRTAEMSMEIIDWLGRPAKLVTLHDITDRKRVEAELEASRQSFASVVDRSSSGIAIVDQKGLVRFANPAAARMFGKQPNGLVGVRLGAPSVTGSSEIIVLGEHGEARTAEMSVEPSDWHGAAATLVTLHDITERKRLHDQLETSHTRLAETHGNLETAATELSTTVEALERSNREFSDFAHAAAHDLRAPLRTIGMFSQCVLSEESEKLSPAGRENIGHVCSATDGLEALIDRLLAYAEVNVQMEEFKPVALSVVVAQVLSDLQSTIAASSADIDVSELPTIYGDEMQMGQLFQNLLGNALKYRDTGVAPRIRVFSEKTSGLPGTEQRCTIHVEDQGIGFDTQYSQRVFEPFQRLVSVRDFEGSGIGLATARKIVLRHRGSIAVRSGLGKGTTFSITLPLAKQAAAQTSAPPVAAHQRPGSDEGTRPRLLLVDDNPGHLNEQTEVLRDSYQIITATSAAKALKLLSSQEFEVVLTDYRMPGDNGIWLLSQVKERYPQLRRALTSGAPPAALNAALRDRTVELYLAKPINAARWLAGLADPSASPGVRTGPNPSRV